MDVYTAIHFKAAYIIMRSIRRIRRRKAAKKAMANGYVMSSSCSTLSEFQSSKMDMIKEDDEFNENSSSSEDDRGIGMKAFDMFKRRLSKLSVIEEDHEDNVKQSKINMLPPASNKILRSRFSIIKLQNKGSAASDEVKNLKNAM